MRLTSPRLVLRAWEDADRQPFAEMSSDPDVMKYLLPLPTRQASDAWIDRQMSHLATHGFCFWAVASKPSGEFMGAVGLLRVGYEAHFTPAVEVGWRIARRYWGQGYAPEASHVALRFGFEDQQLPEIIAHAGAGNDASRVVMAKLGMSRDPADDFDHPLVPEGSPLRRQVLYRLSRDTWRAARHHR